ncbi:MAG: hypothetical protein H6752_18555 [Candidatus Omnitrophica bacterium]|nr:hypothetical protein [Candidatus Omnitrophota bacterium]
MQSGGIESKKAERFLSECRRKSGRPSPHSSSNRYGEFKAQLERGWGYAEKSIAKFFADLQPDDRHPLYLFLIAPSAYFLERILFAHRKIGHRASLIA